MTAPAGGSRRSYAVDREPGDESARKKLKPNPASKPEFHFNLKGFEGGRAVEILALRDMILFLLLEGRRINDSPREPNWIVAENKKSITSIVALLVPGLTPEAFGLPPALPSEMKPAKLPTPPAPGSKLPATGALFAYYCPTRAPGDKYRLHSSLQSFTKVPLTPLQLQEQEQEAAAEASDTTDASLDINQYLLSSDDMIEAAYPMPTYTIHGSPSISRAPAPLAEWRRANGMIETPQGAGSNKETRFLAVDCEMVVTKGGRSEVARVSIVGEGGRLLYDSLVVPENPVIDYATPWSGITEERLRGVTTTLADVQARIAELVDYNTILCGHSLDNDLRVLKFAHPWIIDTSVAYHHVRGPPFKPSLKWLAQRWLSREIQSPNSPDNGSVQPVGHNSLEDATATLELVQLKITRGPRFGEFLKKTEDIFERLKRAVPAKTTAYVDYGQTSRLVGAKADMAVACRTDADVLDTVLELTSTHDFVLGRMQELAIALGWSHFPSTFKASTEAAEVSPAPPINGAHGATNGRDVDIDAAYADLDERLSRLHRQLPAHTALILFSGYGDPLGFRSLSDRKMAFDRIWKARQSMSKDEFEKAVREQPWTAEDDRLLEAEVQKARMGMALFCVRKAD